MKATKIVKVLLSHTVIFFLSANNTKVIMHINILCFENEGHHIHKMGKRE